MGKVSKNSKTNRVAGSGKNHVKVVVSEKDPISGAYVFKEKIIHKDEVAEFFKNNK